MIDSLIFMKNRYQPISYVGCIPLLKYAYHNEGIDNKEFYLRIFWGASDDQY